MSGADSIIIDSLFIMLRQKQYVMLYDTHIMYTSATLDAMIVLRFNNK